MHAQQENKICFEINESLISNRCIFQCAVVCTVRWRKLLCILLSVEVCVGGGGGGGEYFIYYDFPHCNAIQFLHRMTLRSTMQCVHSACSTGYVLLLIWSYTYTLHWQVIYAPLMCVRFLFSHQNYEYVYK